MWVLLLIFGMGGGIFGIVRLVQGFQILSNRVGDKYGLIVKIIFSLTIMAVLSSFCAILLWYLPHEQTMPEWTSAGSLQALSIVLYGQRWIFTIISGINWFIIIAILVYMLISIRRHKDTDDLVKTENSDWNPKGKSGVDWLREH